MVFMDFSTSNKKNGLIYKDDFKTVVGIDTESSIFTGRVPFGAHVITAEVFANTNYESISLPDSVKELGDCLFENAASLKKVKLPYEIQKLPSYLFAGCSSLESVTMPKEITALPEGIFYKCTSLSEPILRPGIKSIPINAFAGCTGFKSVVIPDYITEIKSQAFADCTGLTSVVLPASIMDIAPDAFAYCSNITSVRINGDSSIYFVGKDGSLYEKTAEDDKLIIKVKSVEQKPVDFFQDDEDSLTYDGFLENEDVVDSNTDENFNFTDETFSSEVQITQEEEQSIMSDNLDKTMDNAIDDNVNSMLADIMNDEKSRETAASEAVSVGENESKILTQMMDVMNDKPEEADNGAKVSEDELARLFSSNESSEPTGENPDAGSEKASDPKLQILIDSAELSLVVDCTPNGQPPADATLYVIAEKTVTGEDGKPCFTKKLVARAKDIAYVQDFNKIVFLSGLPVDNDEFVQFYHYHMSQKNVIFACEASNPSKLSEYAKKVCEESRISLSREDLIAQRKKISIKNSTLIKTVMQDKYE